MLSDRLDPDQDLQSGSKLFTWYDVCCNIRGDYVLVVKFSEGDYVLVVKFSGGDYVRIPLTLHVTTETHFYSRKI